jgi:RimJ/RimL family protein N-acetyltransferase
MLDEITLPHSSVALEGLIRTDAPGRPRALAVLDGVLSGRAWADDAERPTAAVVLEDADGTVFTGGSLAPAVVGETLRGVETASGDLIFGFAALDDPARALVPGDPYWSGRAIDFTDRQPPADEAEALAGAAVDGARVVRLDAATLPLAEWYDDTLHAFGSVEAWLELGIGYGVMLGDELAAEALAGPRSRGLMEMGVATREPYRRRGYGTLVSRLCARACEESGARVWWNANAGNAPSIAIARRLGFQTERPYDLVACHARIGREALPSTPP